MRLAVLQNSYQFHQVPLEFIGGEYRDVFSLKNNKSLADTLAHPRYAKFLAQVLIHYSGDMTKPLGTFLLNLKHKGDPLYKRFLNAYGDEAYSCFRLADPDARRAKGIYVYEVDGAIMYIGRCRDSMSKRIDQGYGKIHPKNCYIDGQATNCHLNSLITKQAMATKLWLFVLDASEKIEAAERELVRAYRPPWNIQTYL
jgi:hypothetical protein